MDLEIRSRAFEEQRCGSNDLMSLTKHFSAPQLAVVLSWWARLYSVYSILETVHQGVSRVASLVNALKSYTYMDQAPIQTVDMRSVIPESNSARQKKVTLVWSYVSSFQIAPAMRMSP